MATINGTAGDDDGVSNPALVGTGADDAIYGGDGNDLLEGGAGNDVLDGGNGVDTADYEHATGPITVNLGAGGFQPTGDGTDQLLNIENVIGSAGNDSLRGSAADNALYGGAGGDVLQGMAGNDKLYGGDTDDLLRGGDGNDELYGGNGNDYLSGGEGDDYIDGGAGFNRLAFNLNQGNEPQVGATVDLNQQGVAQNTGHGMDTFINIVHVSGTNFDDVLIGDSQNNWLWGQDGMDTLYGGGGDDLLELGLGSKIADGGAGNNTVSFHSLNNAGTSYGVTVNLALQGGAQADGLGSSTITLSNIQNISGSSGNDVLTGDAGANLLGGDAGSDIIYGGDGDDTIGGDALMAIDPGGFGYSGPITVVSDIGEDDGVPSEDGNDVIYGGNGNDDISGAGGDDMLYGDAGNDSLEGGIGNNTLYGGDGDDVVEADSGNDAYYGGAGNDTLYGAAGTDQFYGGDGNDVVYGGTGNDLVDGGAGNDQMFGGGGINTLSYATATAGVSVNANTTTAQNTGGAGTDTFSGFQIVVGSAFNDTMIGNNVTLYGGAGNDTMIPTGPNAVIDGGAGTDLLYTAFFNGAVTINLGVHAAQNTVSLGLLTQVNMENIMTGGGNDTLTGDSGNNIIYAGLGNDRVDGAGGMDAISYFDNARTRGVHVDLTITGAQVVDSVSGESDTLSNIEYVYGSNYDDVLTGNSGDNGFIGGAGNDIFYGGAGIDYVGYFGATAGVTVSLAIQGVAQDTGVTGMDTLNGIETLIGSEKNDTLTGSSGDDYIGGNLGDDVMDGGAGSDTAIYGASMATGSVTVSLALQGQAQDTGGSGVDTLTNFENISGSVYNDTLTGDGNGNRLSGEGGDDTVYGGAGGDNLYGDFSPVETDILSSGAAGNDTLYGGAGDDVIYGGDGNDIVDGGDGNNQLHGDAGTDTLSFSTVSAAVFVTMANGQASDLVDGTIVNDTFDGFENLTGSNFDDQLRGDTNANVIDGGDGGDTIQAYGGADIAYGGNGDDLIRGGDGDDQVYGGAGNDYLQGNEGNDYLDGGAGVNRVAFIIQAGEPNVGATVDLNLQGQAQNTGHGMDTLVNFKDVSGTYQADVITGDNQDNWLWVLNGNDVVYGGGGNDLIDLGFGDQTADGGSGTNTVTYNNLNNLGDTQAVTIDLNQQGHAQNTGAGMVTLTNFTNAVGGNQGDTLFGDGQNNILAGNIGSDNLYGGTGDDTLYGDGMIGPNAGPLGRDGDITIFADIGVTDGDLSEDGADTLSGGEGNDTLYGGGGNDNLEGGLGNDSLDGGAGIDTAHYDDASGAVSVNLANHTATGADGTDSLTAIENVAGSAFDDTLKGDGGANSLFGLSGNDNLQGQGGDDLVYGGEGADSARGGDGNDQVYGGAGNDYLSGGEGDDYIDGGAGNDRVSFYLNQGDEPQVGATVDLNLQGQAQNTGHGSDTLVNIENVSGTQYDDTLTGDGSDNYLGGNGGTDTIHGGDGNDIIDLGGGSGLADGGNGNDTVSFNNTSGVGVTVSLAIQGASQSYGSGQVTLTSIENLTGTLSNDMLTGDANANIIGGNGGADTIYGGDGDDVLQGDGLAAMDLQGTGGSGPLTFFNDVGVLDNILSEDGADTIYGGDGNDTIGGAGGDDTLYGGAGNDNINGGDGNDTVDGGAGNDTMAGGNGVDMLSYASATSGVTVNLFTTTAQNTGGGGTDTISGFENLTGSSFNDTLIGANVLAGGAGDDVLVNIGNNVLDGGAGNDMAYYGHLGGGVTVDLNVQGVSQNTGAGGVDTLISIENVFGSTGNDVLTGNAGYNYFDGSRGNDIIDGGGGTDVASYLSSTVGVTVNLSITTAQTVIASTGEQDTLINIENLTGSNYDDVLIGNAGNNGFAIGKGNDTVDGGGGTLDWVGFTQATSGVTVSLALQGQAQNTGGGGTVTLSNLEELFGSLYDDHLTGSSGDDVLGGGYGANVLDGGAGNDTAYYSAVTGGVTVSLAVAGPQNTGQGVDTLISIENLVGSTADDTLTGDGGDNVLAGWGGNNSLYGGAGDDRLYGEQDGTNDPALLGASGVDHLYGGAGNDLMAGNGGNDTLDGGAGFDTAVFSGNRSDYTVTGSGGSWTVTDNRGGSPDGTDTVVNTEQLQFADQVVSLAINGSAGNNTLNGTANGDLIYGGDGNDVVLGLNGPDVLYGGNDDDLLRGGNGDDIVYGDAGNDYLSGGEGDDLLDGGAGVNRVAFSVQAGENPVGATVDLNLQGQAQNTGHGMDTLINFTHVSGTSYDDVLTGDGQGNWLWTQDGHDQAYGGGGDDLVEFGFGDKAADGGAGTNTVSYHSLNAQGTTQGVTVDLGQQGVQQDTGAGHVNITGFANAAGADHDDALYGDASANVLAGDLGADALYGGDGADVLLGDGAYGLSGLGYSGPIVRVDDAGLDAGDQSLDGADHLFGGNGDDVINGGGGNDTLDGGNGTDTAVFSGALSDYTVTDLGGGSYSIADNRSGAHDGTDTLTGVENAQFSDQTVSLASLFPPAATLGADELVLTRNVASDLLSSVLLANDTGVDTVTGVANVTGGTVDLVGGKLVITSAGAGSFDYTATGAYGDFTGHATFYTFATGAGDEGYSGGASTAADLHGAGGDDFLAGTVNADHLVGDDGNDTLNGDAGNDVLAGGEGDDLLIGAGGNDALDGGNGTDTAYFYGNLADYTVAQVSGGYTVTDNRSGSPDGTDTLTNVEMLRFADQTVSAASLFAPPPTLTGDDLQVTRSVASSLDASVLLANDTGADTVTGVSNAVGATVSLVGGKLVITATAASGSFDYTATGSGGPATGHVTFSSVLTNASNNTVPASATAVAADLQGLDGNDNLTGTAGADHLVGGNGNDVLDGGAGADQMIGGAGNDTYTVDNAGDVVTEMAGEGTDTVNASISYTLADNVEKLVLTGTAANGTGNSGDNILVGNASDNTLDGGLGADVMQGGLGNDTYYVDDVGDLVTESGSAGTDTVHTTLAGYTLTSNVENLVYDGSGDFAGTGNTLANTITGGAGNDTLSGGSGADTLIGGLGNDTYVVDNAGDVVVEAAGAGVDTVLTGVSYTLGANLEAITATGAGNINLTGNGADNVLTGNAGNNILDGGAGADAMAGGAGNDTYVVENAGDTITENAGEGTDTVNASVNFTLSDNIEKLVLVGAAVSGTGSAQDNTIVGNALDNILDGGLGADILQGGAGNDTYYVDNSGDLVQESSGAGTDTVITTLASYTLTTNVENLTSSGAGDFVLTGNSVANVITGGAGNDILDGKQGADTLIGGAGDDTYVVDNLGDVVVEAAGAGHDTIQTGITYALAAGLSVEVLQATGAGNINLTGNELDNELYGNAGNNVLNGGAGADMMAGGAGDDTYVVDNAGDVVDENPGEGIDTVQASASYVLGENIEKLVLTGTAANGTGNELNNTLTGNAFDNVLDGGAGADTMIGGLGNDTYYVDDAGDLVQETGVGVDTVHTTLAAYTLTANVENLVADGSGDFNGTGNTLANTLTGGDGNDTLNGLAGNDFLYGGVGADNLNGGDGNDVLDGGVGDDTLTGGLGNDTYQVDSAGDVIVEAASAGTDVVNATAASYALSDNLEVLNFTGSGNFTGVGNILANTLNGGAGDDSLSGLAGNDTLNGGSGADSLYGGDGNDILDGGVGADMLDGGLGNDTYLVDDAADVVVEAAGAGTDTVKATSASYTLSSNVEALTFVGSGDFTGTGSADANTITGGAGNDTLYGMAGNDKLLGGAGNDTLVGGAGADTLTGGTGADGFVLTATFDSPTNGADTITDFNSAEGDYIDLSAIDANALLAGDQAFSFIGTTAFSHHAGELRYVVSGTTLTLQGDVNGDGVADFAVKLTNTASLAASDLHP